MYWLALCDWNNVLHKAAEITIWEVFINHLKIENDVNIILKCSSYRAVNTFRVGYEKKNSVNALLGNKSLALLRSVQNTLILLNF